MAGLIPFVQSTGLVFSIFPAETRRIERGDEGDRTLNPRLAKPVLSQLSYVPGMCRAAGVGTAKEGCPLSMLAMRSIKFPRQPSEKVGARRFELRTSSLSGTRSNQLSYAPA